MPNTMIKVHEDFEDLDFILCWNCGDKVIEIMKERFPNWNLLSSVIS
jgi:hypothetical protein